MSGEPVLVVCSDTFEARMLVFALGEVGLSVSSAADVYSISDGVNLSDFGLILFVPDHADYLDSLCIVRELTQVPLVLLIDPDGESKFATALHAGADLIFTKPYRIRFLAEQISALLRRFFYSNLNKTSQFQYNHFSLQIESRIVRTSQGKWFQLSAHEFRLLYMLMSQPGHTVATETLVKQVWNYPDAGNREMLRRLVHRLRRKFEDDHLLPRCVFNVPNVGYYFVDKLDV